MTMKKKLIEVALPLEAINKASAREKSIRHGHPSTLHLWWARRPLAAARAVIFAQLVDDPSEYVETLKADPKLRRQAEAILKKKHKVWEEATEFVKMARLADTSAPEPGPEPTLDDILADIERQRLFRIIEDLVLWENTTNEKVLQGARNEIWSSWRRTCAANSDHPRAKELFDRNKLPAFHDPFAGGGTLPLEAQRLGLESYASDLNPVAVLINKAMIEIPPRFAGSAPVNPEWQSKSKEEKSLTQWHGAQGLAADVRYYGKWMRDEAEKRIGHLYPKVPITEEMAKERPDLQPYVGRELAVIAWLWARTVKSPNPAFAKVDVPLASTFMLSSKAGKEAYVEPIIERDGYRFTVRVGKPKDLERTKKGTKVGRGGNFQCLMSGTPIPVAAIREQGLAGTFGARMMAMIAEGDRDRVFLTPQNNQILSAMSAVPTWIPEQEINHNPRDIRTQLYGLTKYGDLFTPRQLLAMATFSDMVGKAMERIREDAIKSSISCDPTPFRNGGTGATAYAEALGVYLVCALDYASNYWSVIATPADGFIRGTFARQALPMTWDYAEAPPFGNTSGNWLGGIDWTARAIEALPVTGIGLAGQADAAEQSISFGKIVSTDPPYYDNIGYADLSDFFYVWQRRSLRNVFPDLFATVAVPKAEELVATPYRHGSKSKAENFFLDGMTRAMHRLSEQAHLEFPVTIYYAFKQSESDDSEGTASTGWDTFLAAVIKAGFAISGTWPMRTERGARSIGIGTNALASSIVLVCRKRDEAAPTTTRREFINTLKAELPAALAHLQRGNIAPVDLAQAAIGPGMAVYTRYARVLDAEGKPLSVRDALALINQTLDEALADQEGDFDADSRWALTWFEQVGFDEGEFGVAEQLSKSKNTAINGMIEAGILESKRGKVRLLRPEDLPDDWDPTLDSRLTAWETVHHLVRSLESGGEQNAARLVSKLGARADTARELAYRLYIICERKKRAAEALSYNALVQSWPEIQRIASEGNWQVQPSLFDTDNA